MQRRDFLQSSAAAAACLGAAASATAQTPGDSFGDGRQLYEWRTYRFDEAASPVPGNEGTFAAKSQEYFAAKHAKLHAYLKDAFIPAAMQIGLGPIGVFTEIGSEATASLHLMIVYLDAAKYAGDRESLEANASYNAAEYAAAKREDPTFKQIDTWLLSAFVAAPKITPHAEKPRILELRTYKNHSEDRARAKIAMFNDGEIDIFPKCGFENVFFGEVLAGVGQPCLKYMLAAPDMAANEAGWKKFLAHPDFVRMKDDPKYADTQPEITKLFLEPTDYSQV